MDNGFIGNLIYIINIIKPMSSKLQISVNENIENHNNFDRINKY
jgi:hypothetical protein